MANAQGGTLYLGIEDNGTVTGLHPKYLGKIDGLAALIYNMTNPNLSVQTEDVEVDGLHIAKIVIPRASRIIFTSRGSCLLCTCWFQLFVQKMRQVSHCIAN